MYLLDTNIVIYFMKDQYPQLTRKLYTFHPSELLISSVTVFELEYGAEKSKWGQRTRNNLAKFLAPFTILPFESADAIAAGRIRGYLEKNGTKIGPYDVQIAGQALIRGLTVVTHNTGEFKRVPGLKMEDWTEE